MSKIEVNTVEPQCGTTVTVGKCTSTVAVPGNVVKSNALQASDGGNIVSQSGTDITLGASGDTVALASGASQTGFGRTGTVDWQTGDIKTGTFTAATGEGYFVNTSGGISTVNLPAGVAGSIVALSDYTRTWNSNNVTVTPNGSEKIGGADAGGSATLSVDGQSATFVYVDGTEGWINIQETQTSQKGATSLFVVATGGTPCTGAICGNFKTHVFTGPGTLCVSCAGNACGSTTVDYLVAAGGGGGASANSAGGGAGGFRLSNSVGCMPAPTMSPLSNPTGITVSATGYPITVGGGGASPAPPPSGSGAGVSGSNSIFSTITSTGGGGGNGPPAMGAGVAGGSGGGGKGGPTSTSGYPGGAGNTPPFSPSQGNPGGAGYDGVALSTNSGGGGGAGAAGGNAAHNCGGDGGIGSFVGDAFLGPIAPSYGEPGPVGSSRYFTGGGGGGCSLAASNGLGGAGGGGCGRGIPQATATVNTGGGGGGSPGGTACCTSTQGGAGGSGVVIIRYKFQ